MPPTAINRKDRLSFPSFAFGSASVRSATRELRQSLANKMAFALLVAPAVATPNPPSFAASLVLPPAAAPSNQRSLSGLLALLGRGCLGLRPRRSPSFGSAGSVGRHPCRPPSFASGGLRPARPPLVCSSLRGGAPPSPLLGQLHWATRALGLPASVALRADTPVCYAHGVHRLQTLLQPTSQKDSQGNRLWLRPRRK